MKIGTIGIGGRIKEMIKNWLQIQPAQGSSIIIQEPLSFEAQCMRNRIIYRGDPSEIEQFFKQAAQMGDTVAQGRFWAAVPSSGLRIRKIHSGLPGAIVDILADIVVTDMLDAEIADKEQAAKWTEIAEENDHRELLTEALQEVLAFGDGAFKISFDTTITPYPIIEFFSGEQVEFVYNRGRVKEVHFKSVRQVKTKTFYLTEIYGIGFIRYELRNDNGVEVDLSTVPELAGLEDLTFVGDVMLAVPLLIYKSPKWEGRGRSIFDRKIDCFDALDEVISQWQDALRLGRIKRYIPKSLVPINPDTGKEISPNPFDNQFIAVRGSMAEGAKEQIVTDQPTIDYEGMLATYINSLDLCLQGLISPSTLGIDVKKLDNAEAQREKEKATLYTRNKIISVMSKVLPELIKACLIADWNLHKLPIGEVVATVGFGEYANPSFEAQVETIGKAAASQIMSIETQVDELYGDSKDEVWKKAEVARIKQERGIAEVMEPTTAPHGFAREGVDGSFGADNNDLPGDGESPDGLDDSKPQASRGVGG